MVSYYLRVYDINVFTISMIRFCNSRGNPRPTLRLVEAAGLAFHPFEHTRN
jgi:hypothetical protein